MKLSELLENQPEQIIDEVTEKLQRSRLRSYFNIPESENREKVEALFELVKICCRHKSLTDITRYAEKIARERFSSGFDLYEVHTVFNVLEETLWSRIVKYVEQSHQIEALGLISSVLGAGKETLAVTYVNLAAGHKSMQEISTAFKEE